MKIDIRELLHERDSDSRHRMFEPIAIGETGYKLSVQNSPMHYCDGRHYQTVQPIEDCGSFEVAVLGRDDMVVMRDPIDENRTGEPLLLAFVDGFLGIEAHDDVFGWMDGDTVWGLLCALEQHISQRDGRQS